MNILVNVVLLPVLALSGCASVSNYCHERPVVCAAASAMVIAGLIMTLSGGDDDKVRTNERPGLGLEPPMLISDSRLKRDIHHLETLPNGIRLHTFRYWNDSRVFVGVLAQELLQDARYRHAVHQSDKGYYTVDLAALGLRMDGEATQYLEASEAAL